MLAKEEDDNCTWKMHKYQIANCIGDPSNHFMDFNFNCKFLFSGHSESLTVALQRLVTLLLTPNSTFDAENDDKNDDWLA